MPHQVHLRTLGRTGDHRLSMLRNLSVSVLRYERVRTTEAKAKEVRRLVDRLVGLGLDGSLNARRRALALTRDRLIVEKVFTDLRDRFADRRSGFTRLAHLGHRVGDGAPMALIELLEGVPAQAKAETPAVAEAPQGGVRGIARRLRGPRREERAPQEQGAETAARAAEKASAPKARKPAAKRPEKKAAPAAGKRPPATETKTKAVKTTKPKSDKAKAKEKD